MPVARIPLLLCICNILWGNFHLLRCLFGLSKLCLEVSITAFISALVTKLHKFWTGLSQNVRFLQTRTYCGTAETPVYLSRNIDHSCLKSMTFLEGHQHFPKCPFLNIIMWLNSMLLPCCTWGSLDPLCRWHHHCSVQSAHSLKQKLTRNSFLHLKSIMGEELPWHNACFDVSHLPN